MNKQKKQEIKTTNFDIIFDYQNCWIDNEGNIFQVDSIRNFETKAIEIINQLDIKEKESCSGWILKNGSLSDWLIFKGFIAVKNSKVYYLNVSEKQCDIISCIFINDILIDKNSVLGKKYSKQKSKQEYDFKQKYYGKILPHVKEKYSKLITK